MQRQQFALAMTMKIHLMAPNTGDYGTSRTKGHHWARHEIRVRPTNVIGKVTEYRHLIDGPAAE